MPNRAVSQVNLAVAPARFEGKAAATLPQAAHLENLGGGKLVEIADERVTGVDAFGGYSALSERPHKRVQLSAQASLAAAGRYSANLLLVGCVHELLVVRFRSEADDVQRGKMLPGVGCLFERDGRLAFHDESIKIFGQQDGNGLRQSADNPDFDAVDLIEYAKSAVLKDRVGVQY
jgi:hypothetical protein